MKKMALLQYSILYRNHQQRICLVHFRNPAHGMVLYPLYPPLTVTDRTTSGNSVFFYLIFFTLKKIMP